MVIMTTKAITTAAATYMAASLVTVIVVAVQREVTTRMKKKYCNLTRRCFKSMLVSMKECIQYLRATLQ